MQKSLFVVGGLIIGVLVGLFVFQDKELGSVNVGNDYSWSSFASPTASTTSLSAQRATLGSIIIAEKDASTFVVKNATSSTDLLGETVVSFANDPTEGVYTFDIVMDRGIQITTGDAFDGEYIVTYR